MNTNRIPAAIIFDLDGTLLDTLDDLADSMNAALAAHGLPRHSRGDYCFFVGDGAAAMVRRALPPDRSADEGLFAQVLSRLREEYGRRWRVHTRLYAGIDGMLDRLTEHELPLAVLSNKPQSFVERIAGHYLHRWPLCPIRGERDGVPRKPAPRASLEIAAELGVNPADCWHIGDTDTDIQTAIAAGMFPVGACWGFRPRRELVDAGARLLLDSPGQLLDNLPLAGH